VNVLVLLGSLGLLTLGAEALVRGASVLALRAGVSALFVGLTIVGFGTSSPELAASLTATLAGSHGVSVGNVVGSNLFNVGIILGLTALLHPIRVELSAVRRDLGVAIVAAAVPTVVGILGGSAGRGIGAGLLLGLAVYLVFAFRGARAASASEEVRAEGEVESTLAWKETSGRVRDGVAWNLAMVGGGLTLLVVGSRGFVGSAIEMARALGVSDLVIGLTIVSAGTSLPEVITSLVAARRRNPDIAIGNVIGSNLFNVLGIFGGCALVAPQTVPARVAWIDGPLMVLATLALAPVFRTGGVVSRREGGFLVGGYLVYLTFLLVRG